MWLCSHFAKLRVCFQDKFGLERFSDFLLRLFLFTLRTVMQVYVEVYTDRQICWCSWLVWLFSPQGLARLARVNLQVQQLRCEIVGYLGIFDQFKKNVLLTAFLSCFLNPRKERVCLKGFITLQRNILGVAPSKQQWQIKVYRDSLLKMEESWWSLLMGRGHTQGISHEHLRRPKNFEVAWLMPAEHWGRGGVCQEHWEPPPMSFLLEGFCWVFNKLGAWCLWCLLYL